MAVDWGGFGQAAGQLAGGPWGALAGGLIGGLFGGQQQLPPELKRLYRFQYGQADQLRRFAQSVPLSDPQEQAALASQRGLLGEQQRSNTANLTSQIKPSQQATTALPAFLATSRNNTQARPQPVTPGP